MSLFFLTGLSEIPDGLSALSKLVLLRLDSCKGIKQIPPCLASLRSLRELYLDDTAGISHVDSISTLTLDKLSLRFASASSVLRCLLLFLPVLTFRNPCLPVLVPLEKILL